MHDVLLDHYERQRTGCLGCLGVLVGVALEAAAVGVAVLLAWWLR